MGDSELLTCAKCLGTVFLYVCILFFVYLVLKRYFWNTEGFEDTPSESPTGPSTVETELRQLYGDLAKIACPALKFIEDDFMRDPTNARKNPATVMRKAMGGRPIFCPPPELLTDLPADIGERTTRTVTYLDTKTAELRKKMEDQFGNQKTCEPDTKLPVETFVSKEDSAPWARSALETFVSKEDEDTALRAGSKSFFETFVSKEDEESSPWLRSESALETFVSKEDEDAEPPASKDDETLQDAQKQEIYTARLQSLKQSLLPQTIQTLQKIKENTEYLQKTKELAESGKLKPSCSVS